MSTEQKTTTIPPLSIVIIVLAIIAGIYIFVQNQRIPDRYEKTSTHEIKENAEKARNAAEAKSRTN